MRPVQVNGKCWHYFRPENGLAPCLGRVCDTRPRNLLTHTQNPVCRCFLILGSSKNPVSPLFSKRREDPGGAICLKHENAGVGFGAFSQVDHHKALGFVVL